MSLFVCCSCGRGWGCPNLCSGLESIVPYVGILTVLYLAGLFVGGGVGVARVDVGAVAVVKDVVGRGLGLGRIVVVRVVKCVDGFVVDFCRGVYFCRAPSSSSWSARQPARTSCQAAHAVGSPTTRRSLRFAPRTLALRGAFGREVLRSDALSPPAPLQALVAPALCFEAWVGADACCEYHCFLTHHTYSEGLQFWRVCVAAL